MPSASPPDEGTPKGAQAEKLFAALYTDLRALADRHVNRSPNAPVSATTLVHEAYLNLAGSTAVFPDRARFMGYVARVMRSLIIDLIREGRALKRGASFQITQLPTEIGEIAVDKDEVERLSAALDELGSHDPRLAEVVDLRYFCGFTYDEIAAQTGVASRTVKRDWEKARILLFGFLQDRD